MSEHDETPALTRRERRLQALGETGSMPTVDAPAAAAEAAAVAAEQQAPAATDPVDEIEISPTDPDGRPRSRREIRELRERARAEMEAAAAAEQASAEPASAEPEPAEAVAPDIAEAEHVAPEPAAADPAEIPVTESPAEPTLETVAAEIIETEAPEATPAAPATIIMDSVEVESNPVDADTDSPERDAEASPEGPGTPADGADANGVAAEPIDPAATQAFSIAEIAEASGSWSEERAPETAGIDFDAMVGQATAQVAEEAGQADDANSADEPAADQAAPAKPKKRKLGWKKKQDGAAEDAAEQASEGVAPQGEAPGMPAAFAPPELIEPAPADEAADAPVVPEVAPQSEADSQSAEEPEARPDAPAAPAAPQSARTGYSFPDIVPLDDGMSVFDDPAVHRARMGQSGQGPGDFEDLISRAVAQEGAASTTNTSALILPSMPESSELTGPLGATGDLFLTGSIELPKSLGETGGHAALHDSIDVDAAEEVSREAAPSDPHGATPVSAARAVSARSAHSVAVVNENKRGTKTLPIILMSAGGVLLVGVVGLLIWGASNGMFG